MSNYITVNSDDKVAFNLKPKAFTLIELLVVIAIIALLLSIVMPALNMVKKKASSAVCLTNVKNLALAWFSYQEENHSVLVNPNTTDYDSTPRGENRGWVCNPFRANGEKRGLANTNTKDPVTDEDEIRGIEKGALYVYLEDPEVYHCPGDNVRRSVKGDQSNIFRTYSSPRCIKFVKKFTRISTPGMRFNFIEEHEAKNWNQGTWDFYSPAEPFNDSTDWEWRDPVGNNHGDSGILGFCDGHAEVHKWQEAFTLGRIEEFFANPERYVGWGKGGLADQYVREDHGAPFAENDRDIAYMAKSWADRSD